MLVEFRDWIGTVLAGYTFAYGMWVETDATAAIRYCVVRASGGSAPSVDDRYPRFRVILLGRRGQRQDAEQLIADAQALMSASLGDSGPCGAANVRAITEPSGPGFTTENRAWVQVDFETIF